MVARVAGRRPRRLPGDAVARYFRADPDAPYVARYPHRSVASSAPLVAKPFSPDNVVAVDRARRARSCDGVFIGACTTTEEELVLGALVLEAALGAGQARRARSKRIVVPGRPVHPGAPARGAGCGRSTSAPASAWTRPAARCAWACASEKAGKGETLAHRRRTATSTTAWARARSPTWPRRATVAASALGMQHRRPAAAPGAGRPGALRAACSRRDAARTVPESRVVEPEIDRGRRSGAGAREGGGGRSARHGPRGARAALRRQRRHRRHHPGRSSAT